MTEITTGLIVTLSQSIITFIGHVNIRSIPGFANQDEGSLKNYFKTSMNWVIDGRDDIFVFISK